MTVYVPGGLIAVAIVLYFTFSANKKSRLAKRERAQNLKNIRQEYLTSIVKSRAEDGNDIDDEVLHNKS